MRDHSPHRAPTSRQRREAGYTLTEVVVSLMILMIAITTITAAVASVQVSSAQARLRALVVEGAHADLAVIAAQSPSSLLDESFTVPHPCPEGIPSETPTSCVMVSQRPYPIEWVITPQTVPSDAVLVTGTATVGGQPITVSQLAGTS